MGSQDAQSNDAIIHNDLDKCAEVNLKGIERIHYLENLMSKQLELYTWCEEKVTTLATIDTILLGGAIIFVGRIKTNTFPARSLTTCWEQVLGFFESNFAIVMVIWVLVPLFASLAITLLHVIPKMRSGKTPRAIKNHRSTVGIRKYKDKNEYKQRLDSMSIDDIYHDLVRQIYGMNANIWKNQVSIKFAVLLDLLGLIGFAFILVYLAFTGNLSVIFR